MSLTLETLESRHCASAVDAGGGLVRFDSGVVVSVYGDGPGGWAGRLNVADLGGEIDVGPGPGGGPRLARLDPKTGGRVAPDVFLGDAGDRSGLVPLRVDVPPPAAASYGPDDGYPLFIDVENPAADGAKLAAAVYGYFAPAGNVRVTTERPRLKPNDYATVVVGGPIAFGPPGVIGLADLGAVTRPKVGYASPTAFVGLPNSPLVVAHEAGHLFGLVHVPDPTDIMSTPVDPRQSHFSAAEIRTIHDNAAGAVR